MKKQAAEEKATEVFGGEEEEYAGEGTEPNHTLPAVSVVIPVCWFNQVYT